MKNKQTVLLTGATGFLGSHLLEALLAENYQVIILKRSTSDTWRIDHLLDKIMYFDLDQYTLSQVFQRQEVDVIVHLATCYKKHEESIDIAEMVNTNVGFPSQLLAESVKHGVKGFINTGTFFEYESFYQPIDESANISPFNFYAKTKLAFESILQTYKEQLCINTFRLFSPFGERDNPKLLPMIIQKALKEEEIHLSEGLQKLDLIYVKDIVSAYMSSIQRMFAGDFSCEYEVFNLGSGEALSVRDIVSLVQESLGHPVNVVWGEPSKKDIPIAYAKIDKVKNVLAWAPDIGVKKGISNCIKYYKEGGNK